MVTEILWTIARGAAFVSLFVVGASAFTGLVVTPALLAMHFESLWWLVLYSPCLLFFFFQIGKDFI